MPRHVADMHRQGLDHEPMPEVYAVAGRDAMDIVVRASGDLASIVSTLRVAIRAVDPRAVIEQPRGVRDALDGLAGERKFQTAVLSAFAILALVIAASGTFGVMHYSVKRRLRELGIRRALGAPRGQIVRSVLGEAMLVTCIGLGLGLALTLAAADAMQHLLFGIDALDPASVGLAPLILLVTAAGAAAVPAWRAGSVDPLVAIRSDTE